MKDEITNIHVYKTWQQFTVAPKHFWTLKITLKNVCIHKYKMHYIHCIHMLCVIFKHPYQNSRIYFRIGIVELTFVLRYQGKSCVL